MVGLWELNSLRIQCDCTKEEGLRGGQELGRASLRVCVVVVGCPWHECILPLIPTLPHLFLEANVR